MVQLAVDLAQAARDLVDAAKTRAEPATLKGTVGRLLDGFERAPAAARTTAIKTLGRALPEVDGRGAQVLCLALGALVEGGASPELVWPFVADDLHGLLDHATAFATAAVQKTKERHVDTAIEKAGSAVARKMPEEASAWNALPSRCLTAVACLTHSKKVRKAVKNREALIEATWSLSDAVASVGDLLQALRIVDGAKLLVLSPSLGRGWRVSVDALASNAELYILLADAIVGDAKKGLVPGKRPDRRAVTAIKSGKNAPAAAASIIAPFQLLTWTAAASGELEGDHTVWMEGLPADIPEWKHTRVVLLREGLYPRPIPVVPSFEALRPELRVEGEVSSTEVTKTLAKLRAALETEKPHEHTPQPKKAGARAKRATKTRRG